MKDTNNKKLSSTSNHYFKNSFSLPNPGLRAYFQNVVRGNSDEYRTPFFKGKTPTQVLNNWNRTLKSVATTWPTLYEFEKDLGSKVGPMSIMKPLSERMDDIDSYYDLILKDHKPIHSAAIDRVLDEYLGAKGVRMRGQFQTMLKMKKSTNSGSPFFAKRNRVTTKTIPCDVGFSGNKVWQVLNNKRYDACAILGWRGQEGGPLPEDVKQRVVWMFPYAINLMEATAYQPLIERFQKLNLVPAWVSNELVDKRITDMFHTKSPHDLVICTDFSKFDQHFNSACQDAAMRIIKGILADHYPVGHWLNNVFPIKYMIPIAYDYGRVRFGKHGMASGSGGTNFDETVTHRSLQHEVALLNGEILNPNSQCLGDDGVLTYPGITVEDVMSVYTSHGLDMNHSKQYASTQDCVYLRRWHHKDYVVNDICVGVYSTNRALGRLMEQERYYDPEIWNNEMVCLRQLSIIENCKYHPLREEFVDFCMKGDKFRLGLDLPGFLDNIESKARKATDVMPDFLGYTRSLMDDDPAAGINDWWIVKYLRSLA